MDGRSFGIGWIITQSIPDQLEPIDDIPSLMERCSLMKGHVKEVPSLMEQSLNIVSIDAKNALPNTLLESILTQVMDQVSSRIDKKVILDLWDNSISECVKAIRKIIRIKRKETDTKYLRGMKYNNPYDGDNTRCVIYPKKIDHDKLMKENSIRRHPAYQQWSQILENNKLIIQWEKSMTYFNRKDSPNLWITSAILAKDSVIQQLRLDYSRQKTL